MKKIILFAIFSIIASFTVVKSQENSTNKGEAVTIDIIAPINEEAIEEDSVYILVDKNARFQDGDLEKFREWVQKNLVYPPLAMENGIQGTVVVEFYINSKGKLVDSRILRAVDPLLDNEVLQVVNQSPDWEPATVKGKAVKQQFVMPVIFGLMTKKRKR